MKELFLLLNNCPCDYRCIFCSRGLEHYQVRLKNYFQHFDFQKEFLSIQNIIFNSYHRMKSKLIKIGNNEPLNHPNIISIIEFSRNTGYKKILIQTSGVRFSNLEFTKKIINAGLTHVELPIYGACAKTHDKIVRLKGSFNLMMQAINNLKKFHIDIKLHTLLLKQNLEEVCVMRRKFNDIVVRFPFPDPGSPSDYKKICVKLSDIPLEVRKGVKLKIPCILNKESSDTVLPESGEIKLKPDSPDKIVRSESCVDRKAKLPKCKSCHFFKHCDGIYPLYLEIYGDGEFNPRFRDSGRFPGHST